VGFYEEGLQTTDWEEGNRNRRGLKMGKEETCTDCKHIDTCYLFNKIYKYFAKVEKEWLFDGDNAFFHTFIHNGYDAIAGIGAHCMSFEAEE